VNEKLLERIARAAGVPGLVDRLADRLSPADIQSLLMEVYARRAASVTPAGLLRAYRANRFVRPSAIDPIVFAAFDLTAFALLPAGFEAVELSPLCPLGTCSAVAPVPQNNIVGCLRGAEVVADATNVLALECASRRKSLRDTGEDPHAPIKLAAGLRQVRGQPLSDEKYTAHFKVFCLATAGRDSGGMGFEIRSLQEHIGFYLALLGEVLDFDRPGEGRPEVFLTDFGGGKEDLLRREVLDVLAPRFPRASFGFDPARKAGRGYYTDGCFKIGVAGRGGKTYDQLVDGGFTDWTRKLLADRKERFLASGIGSELLFKI
jgi:hypothetical protein